METLIKALFYRCLSPFVETVRGTDTGTGWTTKNLGGSCPSPVPSAICVPEFVESQDTFTFLSVLLIRISSTNMSSCVSLVSHLCFTIGSKKKTTASPLPIASWFMLCCLLCTHHLSSLHIGAKVMNETEKAHVKAKLRSTWLICINICVNKPHIKTDTFSTSTPTTSLIYFYIMLSF